MAELVQRILAGAEGGQPAEPDGEDEDTHDRREVDGGTQPDQGDQAPKVVDDGVAPVCLEDTKRDRHRDRKQHGQANELKRQRQPVRDERNDILAEPVTLPEIAAEGAPEPGDVLGERVAHQSELLPQGGSRGRVHLLPTQDDEDRVARSETHEGERDERDEQEDRDEREQAPKCVRDHLTPPFSGRPDDAGAGPAARGWRRRYGEGPTPWIRDRALPRSCQRVIPITP